MSIISTTPRRRAFGSDAFTLIELLIVVAIIAILAAIAVPNFLEAQVRAKISRARTDMRSVATALESYRVDNNQYPFTDDLPDPDGISGTTRASDTLTTPNRITTPIAYISSHPEDVFKNGASVTGPGTGASLGQPFSKGDARDKTFIYLAMRQAGPDPGDPGLGFGFFTSVAGWQESYDIYGEWRLSSLGPVKQYPSAYGVAYLSIDGLYDPTNGTTSNGMVVRTQRDGSGGLSK